MGDRREDHFTVRLVLVVIILLVVYVPWARVTSRMGASKEGPFTETDFGGR
jgi:hypothetical protein